MFEIKPGDCTGVTNKLLFNIYFELKKLNAGEPGSKVKKAKTEGGKEDVSKCKAL